MENYLAPTYYLDSDNAAVIGYAHAHTNAAHSALENAVQLYYAVRDGFWYNPYRLDFRPKGLKASAFLERQPPAGHCLNKALLLAAAARVVHIPSRLSFYQVRNHLATERLEKMLGTNLLVFHTAAELFLEGVWVKATPAFNQALCTKMNVAPLEFTGHEDSIFQQYDSAGQAFMSYEYEYGAFDDMPFELMKSELLCHYGHVLTEELIAAHGGVIDVESLAKEIFNEGVAV
jgi:transglutaminase-like putative cysteine protease